MTPEGDVVKRQSTGTNKLHIAEGWREAHLHHTPEQTAALGFTVHDCIAKYIAGKEEQISEKALCQNKLAMDRLGTFAATRGVLYVKQLTVDILEDFKVLGFPPEMKSTSKAHAIAKVRCFLKVAYRCKWISEPLVEQMTTLKAVYDQKEPYTDEEVTKILDEALKLDGATHGYAKQPATFRLLLELMLDTGMRIGDSIIFNPATLVRGDKMWIYSFKPQKQRRTEKPKTIESYISDELKQAIASCKWLSPELPFKYGGFRNKYYLGNQVYERMQTIGARCEVADCRPHRLRDTFAVRRLLNGMQLDEVSRLLGHSSVKVTETYYAKWVSSRKTRLERLLSESFNNGTNSDLRNEQDGVAAPVKGAGIAVS